jgi:hypothetical protein
MENKTSNALTPFMRNASRQLEALHQEESRTIYEKANHNLSINTEYWGHNDPQVQKEFVKNENIVNELTEKLKGAKEDEAPAIMQNIRKFKRAGVELHGFFKTEKVNEKTGEIEIDSKTGLPLESWFVRFFDPYNGKLFRMGQAMVVGTFRDLEAQLSENNATAIGIAFDIEFVGRYQNSKNEFQSDRYDIKPSDFQPLSQS